MCRTVLVLALLGCARTVSPEGGPDPTGGSGMAGGGGSGGAVPPDAGPTLPPEADLPGRAPFARLTALEYRNTLRDLLGVTQLDPLLSSQELDSWTQGFASGIGRGPGDVERINRVAGAAAAEAARNLTPLLPCSPVPGAAAEQEACARLFITRFGLRAYRRPLDTAEVEALLALYRRLRGPESEADFPGAIRLLIEAMLQSPFFVYRWEVTPPLLRDGSLVRFGPFEVASRLSYGLWASMPDDQLFEAAAANALSTPEQLEQQARRLLAHPRARDMVFDFHAQLLRATDLPGTAKEPAYDYSPALGKSMQAELAAVTGSLIVGPGARGTLEDLLASTSTFVDAGLARIYGLPAPPAMGLSPAALDPAQRAGLLTQTAFLTGNSTPGEGSVVQRGKLIFEDLLCQTLPAPDPTSVADPAPQQPGATTRERYARHHMDPCAKCHLSVDPLGFAFLNYDAVGAYHATEQGKPIDASGALDLPSGKLQWKDGVDLARKLAKLEEVRACMAKQWFRYLLRRQEGPGDALSLRRAGQAFQGSSHVLADLIVALTRTRAFTHRTPAPGEVLP